MDLINPSSNTPQQSIEGRPALQRQSSTSSSGSAASSHTRPRKAIRSTQRRTSASALHAPEDGPSGSRRESISSMRTSSAPLEGPVTYTPTTHRISKAKKGKRVHACEFPGCNKIFTRAEHKRRHELNHSPEASYPCDRAGCRKAFHRPDLLQRHQERHELESQTDGGALGHRRLPSDQSSTSGARSIVTSTSMTSPPMVSVQASSNGLSIPSLLHPASSEGYGHSRSSSAYDFVPRAPFSLYTSSISASDDFTYSSPESSQSPLSDHYGFPHRSSISSSSSVVDFVPPNCASPLLNSTASGWAPVLPPSALPSNCTSLEDEMGGFSSLDRHEWFVLQRELAAASGAVESRTSGLEIFDLVKWQDDCLACYWRYFHPLFPIVHQPTFSATFSALMTAVMIAIGSQYDTRTNAKDHSLALLEVCAKSLSKRDNIHSQSRVSDLQTVFLLEVLAKFRSRKAEIGLSPKFRALFASLNHTSARHWISTNPFAVLKGLSQSPSEAELQQAHAFWVNRETRRRLLLGSFILDTQQAVLFEQQPVLFPSWSKDAFSAQPSTLPCPCDNELWECDSVERWAELATLCQQSNLSAAADPATYSNSDSLDSFRSTLILAYLATVPSIDSESGPDVKLAAFCEHLAEHEHSGRYAPIEFDIHAHRAAMHTPIRSLLIVSGESWLFGKKLEIEDDYHAARLRLREWVASHEAQAALWHATAVLRMVFAVGSRAEVQSSSPSDAETPAREMKTLHEQWCIYIAALICWACTFDESTPTETSPPSAPTPLALTNPNPNSPLDPDTTPPSPTTTTTTTTTPTTAGHPPLLDAVETATQMRRFLQTTHVRDPSQLPEALASINGLLLCQQTKALLEAVRMRKINGAIGGLLNEGSGVLYRLVERRSRMSGF